MKTSEKVDFFKKNDSAGVTWCRTRANRTGNLYKSVWGTYEVQPVPYRYPNRVLNWSSWCQKWRWLGLESIPEVLPVSSGIKCWEFSISQKQALSASLKLPSVFQVAELEFDKNKRLLRHSKLFWLHFNVTGGFWKVLTRKCNAWYSECWCSAWSSDLEQLRIVSRFF